MTETQEKLSERDEAEMLLPWYVAGTLTAKEKAHVDTWLARDPALARQLALLEDDRSATISANEEVRLPSTLSVHGAMGKITGIAIHGDAVRKTGVLVRLRDFFAAPEPMAVRWAAAAAAAIILVQAAWLGSMLSGREPVGSYQTASGASVTVGDGSYALVRFADGASIKDVSAALAGLEMSIVEGPRTGGFYRVRIGAKGLTEQQRDQRIAALRGLSALVVLATPTSEK